MRFVLIAVLLWVVGCAPAHVEPAKEVRAAKPRADGDPVAAALTGEVSKVRPGDSFAVLVVLDVAPSHEIQVLHAPPPAIATAVDLRLPRGFRTVGEWSAPQPVRSQWPDGHKVFVGQVTFAREVRVDRDVGPGEYELHCAIRYQVCNDRYCLPPVQCDLAVVVPVTR